MNWTISSLVLMASFHAPQFAGRDRLFISNSKFRHSFHHLLFNSRVAHISNCAFSRFLSSPIQIQNRKTLTGYSWTPTDVRDSELIIERALFERCTSQSGAVVFEDLNGECQIKFSIFTQCSSEGANGAFNFQCSAVTIRELGVDNCIASNQYQAFSIDAKTTDISLTYVHRSPGDIVGRGPCQECRGGSLKMRTTNNTLNLVYDSDLDGYDPAVCVVSVSESFDIALCSFNRCQATYILTVKGPWTGTGSVSQCNFLSNRPSDAIFGITMGTLMLTDVSVAGELQVLIIIPPRSTPPPTPSPVATLPLPTVPPPPPPPPPPPARLLGVNARPLLTQDQLFRFGTGGSAVMKNCYVAYEFPKKDEHLIQGENVASMFSQSDIPTQEMAIYGSFQYSAMYATLVAEWGGILVFNGNWMEVVSFALVLTGMVFLVVYMSIRCFCIQAKSEALLV